MTFLEIIKKYDLQKYFKYLLFNNTSFFAPYHNYYHIQTVTSYCYDIALSEKISFVDTKALLIAALFHDINHSQGKLSDKENVSIAIDTIIKFMHSEHADATFIYKVSEIIMATEYPYVIEEKDLTAEQRIIRDADLLQIFKDTWISMNIFGLSTEMFGRSKEINDETINLFLDGSIKFVENIKFNTKTCQTLYQDKLDSYIKDIQTLKNILI